MDTVPHSHSVYVICFWFQPTCWITHAYWLREADKVRPAVRVSVLAVIISLLVSVDEVFLEMVYLPKLDPPWWRSKSTGPNKWQCKRTTKIERLSARCYADHGRLDGFWDEQHPDIMPSGWPPPKWCISVKCLSFRKHSPIIEDKFLQWKLHLMICGSLTT